MTHPQTAAGSVVAAAVHVDDGDETWCFSCHECLVVPAAAAAVVLDDSSWHHGSTAVSKHQRITRISKSATFTSNDLESKSR